MDQLLTVLVQTSPIPSHPSTALLEALFRSFQKADGLLESRIFILCDGCELASLGEKENNKHGKASLETVAHYRKHLQLLEAAVQQQQPPFVPQANGSIQLLQLKERHGQARAIEAAFAAEGVVTTPLVMMCQHDNFFVKDVAFRACALALYDNPGLGVAGAKCLHFLSTSTLDYKTKVRKRYGIDIDEIPAPIDGLENAKLVPLLFWYGRTHLSYSSHFRNVILNRPLQTGDHLEEILGVAQLEDIRKRGMEVAFRDYGTYVLDTKNDPGEVIYHLSGRRVRAASVVNSESAQDQPPKKEISERIEETQKTTTQSATTTEIAGSSFTTARSCRAVVPGLEIIAVDDDPHDAAATTTTNRAKPNGRRFKQKCFHCGEKGHSFKFCPNMVTEETPKTVTIDLS